jgi:hypothetical protein
MGTDKARGLLSSLSAAEASTFARFDNEKGSAKQGGGEITVQFMSVHPDSMSVAFIRHHEQCLNRSYSE